MNLLSETLDDTDSGDKYDDHSIISPLIRGEEMHAMDSGDESDDEPISTKMLEDIREGSNSHLIVNRRGA